MYRDWVHIREGLLSGLKMRGDDTIDKLKHYYKYGYWLDNDFLDDNMYINIIDENILDCEFRGLIACSRWYKRYNKKNKKYDFITFVTIGYKNLKYIDLIVKGWINVKTKHICHGFGKLILNNGYACVNVNKINFI